MVRAGRLSAVTDNKTELRWYLQSARDALLWKLDGLSEDDVRRPLTPTGTNLLGLVKHASYVEWSRCRTGRSARPCSTSTTTSSSYGTKTPFA